MWSMMGMKKFSILDDGKTDVSDPAPDLGEPVLGAPVTKVELSYTPAGADRVRINLQISVRKAIS